MALNAAADLVVYRLLIENLFNVAINTYIYKHFKTIFMKYSILFATVSVLFLTIAVVTKLKIQFKPQPTYKVYYEYNVYKVECIGLDSIYYCINDTIPIDTIYVKIK